jgi:hypothetical protein
VSLLTDLDAFFTEHGRCGDLDAGVKGRIVWIGGACGASIARRADEGACLMLTGSRLFPLGRGAEANFLVVS